MSESKHPLPVTVISGFLGSGKTTLVNRLLKSTTNERLLVLVNDFGDIAIDQDLIMAEEDGMISLANGCVCCSMGGELYEAFDRILSISPPPDHLVIEASGVAEPQKIANFARAEPDLELRTILTVADVLNLKVTLKDPHIKDVVINQFQASDLILMSKSQLSDKEKQQRTLNLINEIAPEKPVVDLADTPNVKELLLNFYPTTDRSSDNCDHHDHHQIFRSWSIKFDTSLATADVKTLFSQLPSQILRAKGLFRCRNDGLLYEIHRVGVRVDIQRKIENENSGDAAKFVIIGLNQSDFEKTTNILKAIFKSCHVNP